MEWTISPSQSLTSEIPEGFLTIDGDFGLTARNLLLAGGL
jgi:hypothetical protein